MPQELSGQESPEKKRKHPENNGLPPLKKFKVHQPTSKLVNGTSPLSNGNGIPRPFMGAPNFAPQHQASRPRSSNGVNKGGTIPPGIGYPSGPPPFPNGIHQPQSQITNGYPAHFPAPHNSQTPFRQPHPQTMPHPAQSTYSTSPQSSFETNGNPHGAHRPGSSQSMDATPSVKKTLLPSTPATKLPPDCATITPASGVSPTKSLQPSPPPPRQYATPSQSFSQSTPSHSFQGSPSPSMAPPTPDPKTVAGVSPLKQSPPRATPVQGVSGAAIFPPAAKLIPSPQASKPLIPIKGQAPAPTQEAPVFTAPFVTPELNGHPDA